MKVALPTPAAAIAVVGNPGREVRASEPKSPPDLHMRKSPRAHQLVERAAGHVKQFGCLAGVKQRLEEEIGCSDRPGLHASIATASRPGRRPAPLALSRSMLHHPYCPTEALLASPRCGIRPQTTSQNSASIQASQSHPASHPRPPETQRPAQEFQHRSRADEPASPTAKSQQPPASRSITAPGEPMQKPPPLDIRGGCSGSESSASVRRTTTSTMRTPVLCRPSTGEAQPPWTRPVFPTRGPYRRLL